MKIFTKKDSEIIKKFIIQGSVFIYPTDTIYGIGCDATNNEAVLRVRSIKQREKKPFSVIVPSKDWIMENCKVKENDLKLLPGPYTLIFKLKKKCVAESVNLGLETLGVRIPSHWFSKIVKETGIPVVTTSVNLSGQKYMTSIDNLDPAIKEAVDFMVYEGPKEGKPSEIIDLATGTKER